MESSCALYTINVNFLVSANYGLVGYKDTLGVNSVILGGIYLA